MKTFIQQLPKAELHIHIEGSLEPQMLLNLAQKNKIDIKYKTLSEVKQAYNFANLQEFLDIYYQGMSVLITEEDFFDLAYAYLSKANCQNVTHAEIFFDPQGHLARGISFATMISGMTKAIDSARANLGIHASLILCFLRHLPESEALKTLEIALEFKRYFIGIGLDSSELGFPPRKFKAVFDLARQHGLHLVAHAGEEGPAEYIWEAIDILGVERIDHGNNAISDPTLIKRLVQDKIPLTMCPLSNQCLKVVPDLSKHQLRKFLDKGVVATINSDDPAYFGGYLNDNYLAMAKAIKLTKDELILLAQNSLQARF